jgi:hypothetical protein
MAILKKRFKVDPANPEHMDMAFRAAEMRKDLDDVFDKHGFRLVMGWEGSHAYIQAIDPRTGIDGPAVTLLTVRRGGKRVLKLEIEE